VRPQYLCPDHSTLQPHQRQVSEWDACAVFMLTTRSPFGYQSVLFESAVEHNGTDEQEAKWLCLTRFGNILGIYCQTGLRHGSFVLGLVITATFDPATDEFVVHLPTVSSAKFWPVGLGSSTTDVVVMEQLVSGERQLGPHFLIVQIGSLQTRAHRNFLDRSVQLSIYRHRAQRLIFKAHWHLRSAKKPKAEAWNEHRCSLSPHRTQSVVICPFVFSCRSIAMRSFQRG
jgi:hypothetical protein